MDYREYVVRLKGVATTIENDRRLKPLIEFERPFRKDDFADLEASIARLGLHDVTIWKKFRDFHSVMNGFLFQWLYQGQEAVSTRSGSAQIAGMQQIYLPENLPPARAKLFYGQRRVIDRISPDDQVAVVFQEGSADPELHYFSDATGDYHKLTLDFDEYLEMLLKARAMYRWQQFFVDDPSFPLTETDAAAFRQSLKIVFPDADISCFKLGASSAR